MKIEKLVGKELTNSVKEIRESSENYDELVLFSKDIATWNHVLTQKLGPPLISPDKITDGSSEESSPSLKEAALDLATPFGGIAEGQTLYYGTHNSYVFLIMIWPWQDKAHVTLKKVVLK
jgi:hypothetical protein